MKSLFQFFWLLRCLEWTEDKDKAQMGNRGNFEKGLLENTAMECTGKILYRTPKQIPRGLDARYVLKYENPTSLEDTRNVK